MQLSYKHCKADGAVRVQVQDATDLIHDAYFVNEISTSTLAADAVVDTRTIVLTAGHGFVTGEVIYINGLYKARVLTVVTNTLTVNQPINANFPAGTAVYRMSSNMNVDGSSGRKIFKIAPPNGVIFGIYSFKINMRSSADMDDTKFGGITALTCGLMFRVKKSATEYNNLFSARVNSEFQLRCEEVIYETKAPSGEFGMTMEYSFIKKGVAARIDGSLGQELQAIVYDNLSVAGVTFLSCVAKGQVVQ